jgi:3-oxoacyl-[acyl-carrier protein] reductase
MDLGLSGRKGIVFAASKGLGRAVVVALAREGVDLVINAPSQDALKAAAEHIRAERRRQRYSNCCRHHDERGSRACAGGLPEPGHSDQQCEWPPARRFSAGEVRGLDPHGRRQYAYADFLIRGG